MTTKRKDWGEPRYISKKKWYYVTRRGGSVDIVHEEKGTIRLARITIAKILDDLVLQRAATGKKRRLGA